MSRFQFPVSEVARRNSDEAREVRADESARRSEDEAVRADERARICAMLISSADDLATLCRLRAAVARIRALDHHEEQQATQIEPLEAREKGPHETSPHIVVCGCHELLA